MNDEKKQPAPLFSMTQEESKAEKLTDPKEKRLANWIEDIVTMQRVNLVLLIVTLMMLILHMALDFFFHV
ncbi:MAG: hypothetical protein ACW981_11410 [Candidatus Hodarchaeales archaeon]|jgi:hypothetical protein